MEGNKGNGVYRIYPYVNNTRVGIQVYCDLETEGGGWTVIQRREEISGPMTRFNRGWEDYVTGFGFLNFSHWLGLEHIAAITSGWDQEILIEMIDWDGHSLTSANRAFHVGGNYTYYQLHTGNHDNDTSADIFPTPNRASYTPTTHVGFSTTDKEYRNPVGSSRPCANQRHSAWWYNDRCFGPNFNGLYIAEGGNASEAISWEFNGKRHPLKFVEMKVRNKNYPKGCPKLGKSKKESKSSKKKSKDED